MLTNNQATSVPVIQPSAQDNVPLPGEIGEGKIGPLDEASTPASGQPNDGLAFLTDNAEDDEDTEEEDGEEGEDDEDDGEEDEDESDDLTPDPKDEKQVRRIMEKYKNDPAALASAVLTAQRTISRKATEQQQQPQVSPGIQPVATPQAPAPADDTALSFHLPDPSTLFNPAIETVSERGYPIDATTQKEYIPHDEFGVQYNLPEYYQAKVQELIDEDPEGNVASAILKVQQMERRDTAMYQQQRMARENELWAVQQRIGAKHVNTLAQEISAYVPKDIAVKVATHFVNMGAQAAQQVRASGVPDPALRDPGVIASAAELYFFNAFRNGDLVKIIDHFSGSQTPSLPGATNGARAKKIPNVTPPVGNNGSASGELTRDQKRLIRAGIPEDQVKKYSDKNFKFDD